MENTEYSDEELEQVKYYAKVKHKFIKTYLDIWADQVKRNPPTLDILDLYAASGWCYCKESDLYANDPEGRWEGSALLAAECVTKYPRGKNLYLNSYNPDVEKQEKHLKILQDSIKSIYPQLKPMYRSLEVKEAVLDALKSRAFNPKYPSLWILDPYAPSQLPWEVIEAITECSGEYTINGVTKIRRPEIIINLFTSAIQRNIGQSPWLGDTVFGLPRKEWQSRLYKYEQESNLLEAILRLYAERLSEKYQYSPIIAKVKDTTKSGVVYCMFLCTNHPAGRFVMGINKMADFKNWTIREWGRAAEEIVAKKSSPPSQTTLF